MPNDGEGQILTRGELLRRLREIENSGSLDGSRRVLIALGMIIAAVENGPIVEDLDIGSMELTRAKFDMSASRDETHVTIVARISVTHNRGFVKERISQAFEDLDTSKPGSEIVTRIF